MDKNIILIGFMGSGKTTIGKRLAKEFDGYRFIDMDLDIEQKTGMAVSQIFSDMGEDAFRKLEADLCKELSYAKSCIIATGGGIIKDSNNIELLKKGGVVIYLRASAEHIYRNVKDDESRPLLNCEDKLERIELLLKERQALYEKQCNINVEVTGLNAKRATEYIMHELERNGIL